MNVDGQTPKIQGCYNSERALLETMLAAIMVIQRKSKLPLLTKITSSLNIKLKD